MATGCLSLSYVPPYEDLDRFRGQWFHTGRWPHEPVRFPDKRVGVIGTGSSGVQAIPQIAKEAAHLYVFQRTPNFSLPARNGPPDPERARSIRENYPGYKERARRTYAGRVPAPPPAGPSASAVAQDEREREFEQRWQIGGTTLMGAYGDLMTNATSNDYLAEFIRRKIRETVRDPAVAEVLSPTDHYVGAKRICIDSDYWDTFNRDNVTLIDLRSTPIVSITESGIDTTSASIDLDIIVFATGYDAMTGPLLNIDVRGPGGHALRDAWKDGPMTYLGLAVAGFPNLFLVTGPGSPSVRANMTAAIEQHVDWIVECLARMERGGYATIEALPDAQADWVRHVADVASETLFDKGNSWYLGSNINGKPRVFMPYIAGLDVYTGICQEVADAGYKGFELQMKATDGAH
jgi:cyclohexanone monooxygenase